MQRPRNSAGAALAATTYICLALGTVACAPLPPSGPGHGAPGTATQLPGGSAPQSSGTARPPEREVHGAYSSGATASGARAGADAAPGHEFDANAIPDAVPIDEPRSRYGNKSPYVVFGKTYTVMDDPSGYVERGVASWYGAKFHGAKTSSGELYDMYAMSAAHKTLPLPCYVRVTNLENGASVIVRVNDRGPFKENRVMDLSYAAAMRLGITAKGTGLVEVRVVGPGDVATIPADASVVAPPPSKPQITPLTAEDMALEPPSTPTTAPAVAVAVPAVARPVIWLQVGAYGEDANANKVRARLAAAGLSSTTIVDSDGNGKKLIKIRVGPFDDVTQADAAAVALDALDLKQYKTVIE